MLYIYMYITITRVPISIRKDYVNGESYEVANPLSAICIQHTYLIVLLFAYFFGNNFVGNSHSIRLYGFPLDNIYTLGCLLAQFLGIVLCLGAILYSHEKYTYIRIYTVPIYLYTNGYELYKTTDAITSLPSQEIIMLSWLPKVISCYFLYAVAVVYTF